MNIKFFQAHIKIFQKSAVIFTLLSKHLPQRKQIIHNLNPKILFMHILMKTGLIYKIKIVFQN